MKRKSRWECYLQAAFDCATLYPFAGLSGRPIHLFMIPPLSPSFG
ncbi:MAG: hypothetical protein PHD04_01125 [Candidatus Pacebacteria bacterium]|nr:hypothetical protein [Candidatus Paceibacterota bacterium]